MFQNLYGGNIRLIAMLNVPDLYRDGIRLIAMLNVPDLYRDSIGFIAMLYVPEPIWRQYRVYCHVVCSRTYMETV